MIVFHKLSREEIREIVELLLVRVRTTLADRGLQLELSDDARDLLVDKGWDPSMGARPLRRAIQRYIEDPLADFVLRSELEEGATVLVERNEAAEGSDDEPEVTISLVKPEPQPVGVGGGTVEADEGDQDDPLPVADDGPAETEA